MGEWGGARGFVAEALRRGDLVKTSPKNDIWMLAIYTVRSNAAQSTPTVGECFLVDAIGDLGAVRPVRLS